MLSVRLWGDKAGGRPRKGMHMQGGARRRDRKPCDSPRPPGMLGCAAPREATATSPCGPGAQGWGTNRAPLRVLQEFGPTHERERAFTPPAPLHSWQPTGGKETPRARTGTAHRAARPQTALVWAD